MRLPVNQPYKITTGFGVPDSNALFGRHSGIDYAVPLNRPVYAPASGDLYNVVSPTGGNMVKIFDGKYWHRLMHNNSFSRNDGAVNEGNEVAKAGTTGLSTGVHVHWDVSTKEVATGFGDFIDPNIWLKQGGKKMLSEDDFYRVFRGMMGRDPTSAEAKSFSRDPAVVIPTLWNNGSQARFEEDKNPTDYKVLEPGKYKVN